MLYYMFTVYMCKFDENFQKVSKMTLKLSYYRWVRLYAYINILI